MVERMAEKRPLTALFLAFLAITIVLRGAAPALAEPPLRGVFADNFIVLEALAPAPKTELRTLAGEPTTLETYQGLVVLLNFWATWCAPCIREMPSLDRLQAALGPEGLQVVAVSVDRGGADIVEPFLRELGIARLEILLDQKFKSARAFAFSGLPTTYVIDVEGRLIGGLEGPAEWDGPEALELLRYYLPKAELQRVGTGSSLE